MVFPSGLENRPALPAVAKEACAAGGEKAKLPKRLAPVLVPVPEPLRLALYPNVAMLEFWVEVLWPGLEMLVGDAPVRSA